MANERSMAEIYDDFYKYANESVAHSKFCERVFGIDLSQDGFSDKNQLDYMIEKLNVTQNDRCLDVGCGNGKIANYVSSKTNAFIDGIDSSGNAIQYASLFENRNSRLRFIEMDINELRLKKNSYSVIYLIDSIYFSENYSKTIALMWNALQPGGRIAFFYSEFVFDKSLQTKKILENETMIAKIFIGNGWAYRVADFTKEHMELMKRKFYFSNELKEEYLSEGNTRIYEKVNEESVRPDLTLSDFEKFSNRYLYILEKRR